MIRLPLTICPVERPTRPAAAWFVPSADPRVWLDEAAAWNVTATDVRVRIVGNPPIGALLSGGDTSTAAGIRPTRSVPFARVGTRLFVPVDAQLDPPVTDAELDTLLPDAASYVWHPATGLVAFEPGDVLELCNLIALPPHVAADWTRAEPAPDPLPGLRSVTAVAPPPEMVIELGRDDIGSVAPEELPGLPRRWPGLPGMNSLRRGMAHIVRAFTSGVPDTAARRTWINALEDWADRVLSAAGGNGTGGRLSADQRRREQELDRLMKLLDENPDAGLRYAIPLSGSGRGRAPASNALGARNVDYSARRLRGAGPSDPWDIDGQRQVELMQRYRAAAERELRLERYRRAAYVYAELLGDMPAAASALRQGRHFREAAALYKDKLKQPTEAAECLTEGGLLVEAIEVWSELGQFERAGDLWRQLGNDGNAASAYNAAASKLMEREPCEAGRILDEKLGEPDRALAVYERAWPDHAQARRALQARFRLLGRLGRHGATRSLIRSLRDTGERHLPSLASALVDVAHEHPDTACRADAQDASVEAIGRGLRALPESRMALINVLKRLHPEDRLLGRDGERYLRQRAPQPAAARAELRSGPALTFRELRRVQLPSDVTWRDAVRTPHGYAAVGETPSSIVLLHAAFNDESPQESGKRVSWPKPPGQLELSVVPGPFMPTLIVRASPINAGVYGPLLTLRPTLLTRGPLRCFAGTPTWLPPDTRALTVDGNQCLLLRGDGNGLTKDVWGTDEGEAALRTSQLVSLTEVTAHPLIAALPGGHLVADGAVGRLFTPALGIHGFPVPESPRALLTSLPGTRKRIAVVGEKAAWLILAMRSGWSHPHRIGNGIDNLRVLFTPTGIVTIGEDEGRAYRTTESGPDHRATFATHASDLAAVFASPDAGGIAVLHRSGLLRHYSLR